MIKTIIVPIGRTKDADKRIDMACALATRYDGHVKALHVMPPASDMFRTIPVEAFTVEAFVQFEADLKEETEKSRERYERQMKATGVRYEWCQQQGDVVSNLNRHARCADLTILTQTGDGFDDIMNATQDFVIENGLPVLTIPKNGASADFKNILIAWDGSRQAAKAVHDALPLLKDADNVTVLTITENDKEDVPEADICMKLDRHGINAEALTVKEDGAVEDQILENAGTKMADLIVAGAWGHRRIREIIFGGVTKKLINNQKHAVFLSH